MHWPCSRDAKNPAQCYSDWDFVNTWGEMQKLLDTGKVHNISVSDFGIRNLERLLSSLTTTESRVTHVDLLWIYD